VQLTNTVEIELEIVRLGAIRDKLWDLESDERENTALELKN